MRRDAVGTYYPYEEALDAPTKNSHKERDVRAPLEGHDHLARDTVVRTQKYAIAVFAQVDERLVKVPDLQERDLAVFFLEFSQKRPHTLHILRQGVERQSLGALQGHTLAFPLADARAVRVVRVAENARHLVIDARRTIVQTTSAPVLRPRLDARRSDGL